MVEDYEKLKTAIIRDGLCQREAAKLFRHGRDTIRKILSHGTPPRYQRKTKPVQPVIAPVKHIIDAWIDDEIERKVPRKQRSNATVIWKRLCEDHGFRGSVYPIRRYLQKRKRGGGNEVFSPLQFSAGEDAQIDWGQAIVMIGSLLVSTPVAIQEFNLVVGEAHFGNRKERLGVRRKKWRKPCVSN